MKKGRQKIASSAVEVYETRCMTKSGQILDVEIRGKDFVYNGKKARLVTVRNLHDRKRAEQEKIAAITMAENVRLRDEFISIASHEFKTPISTLQLQMYMIRQNLKQITPETDFAEFMKAPLKMFERQIVSMQELVESMLDVSRISTGVFTLNTTEFDVTEVVRAVVSAPVDPFDSKQISPIDIELPVPIIISGDKHRLEQIFVNLITNAHKYGNGNPVSIHLAEVGINVVFTITDYGIGIAEEALSRIFNRFERAVSARNISGFGLGLYIVNQIVDAHGGEISVISQPGKGSTFTVRIPKLRVVTSVS